MCVEWEWEKWKLSVKWVVGSDSHAECSGHTARYVSNMIWPCLVCRIKLHVRGNAGCSECHKMALVLTRSRESRKVTLVRSHLSLSATKMTRRSSSSEANTHTTCLTLRQLKRLSKSTCSNLESIGLLNSITWENDCSFTLHIYTEAKTVSAALTGVQLDITPLFIINALILMSYCFYSGSISETCTADATPVIKRH